MTLTVTLTLTLILTLTPTRTLTLTLTLTLNLTINFNQAARPGGPLAGAGVLGRLGDLGTISPEFDVAVSTACGMLDYLVVETAEGGQACINYLRMQVLHCTGFTALHCSLLRCL